MKMKSFENSIKTLEKLIEELEQGDLPLEEALKSAIKIAQSMKSEKKGFAEAEVIKSEVRLSIKTDPLDVSPEEKVSITMDANKAAWISDEIKSAITRLGLSKNFRYFISSEGSEVSVETSLIGLGKRRLNE